MGKMTDAKRSAWCSFKCPYSAKTMAQGEASGEERKALNRPNLARRKPSKSVLLPRWMALILTPVMFLLGHVALPQALSEFSARHGWAHGRPGWLNLLGSL